MSDHISGPRALADPIADITDVYAFPSPEQPGRLVLVLNTLPFAPASAQFSTGLVYRFRLRPLRAAGGDQQAPFVVDQPELFFDCHFSPGAQEQPGVQGQVGTCTTPDGNEVECRVNDPDGGAGH